MNVECVRPGEVSEDELVGHAAGESSRRVNNHVRACHHCASIVASYQTFERRLVQALYRLDCPSSMTLGEYAMGLLPISNRRQVEAHLAACPHCSAELATADGFLEDAPNQTAPVDEPGEDLVTSLGSAIRRIIAQLVSAPSTTPAVALRGGRPITLVYTAADTTLTLHPQAADRPRGQVQLLGFVHREQAALDAFDGAQVRLLGGSELIGLTTVDEIGNFILGPVAPGEYDLELTSGDQQIVVPRVVLTSSR